MSASVNENELEQIVLNNLPMKMLIEKLKEKGIAIPVGTCEKNFLIKLLIDHMPAVPHTGICPVQGSVGNSASVSAEVEVLHTFHISPEQAANRACTTFVVSTSSPAPNHFCIGLENYGYNYIYTAMEGFEHANFPMYQCRRGRDDNMGFLHLYCDADTWTAVEIVGPVGVATAMDLLSPGATTDSSMSHRCQCDAGCRYEVERGKDINGRAYGPFCVFCGPRYCTCPCAGCDPTSSEG
jgi:hypothetical protein